MGWACGPRQPHSLLAGQHRHADHQYLFVDPMSVTVFWSLVKQVLFLGEAFLSMSFFQISVGLGGTQVGLVMTPGCPLLLR